MRNEGGTSEKHRLELAGAAAAREKMNGERTVRGEKGE